MRTNGFTLVELLVAVGIIGVLASVSVVSVNSVRQKGRDAKRVSEVKQAQQALEAFYTTNNSYPLGLANAQEVTNLGYQAAADAAAGDELVMCTTDNNADAAVNEYGGLGFYFNTDQSAAGGDNKCVGIPFMQKVPRDPLAPARHYKYRATNCALSGANAVSPCGGYELKFTLESRTGDFAAGERTATPNGIQ